MINAEWIIKAVETIKSGLCNKLEKDNIIVYLNCDFYKKYLAGGQVYIGDSPCQWCENKPYKISFAT